jgi:AcrR family transcriptional regulator
VKPTPPPKAPSALRKSPRQARAQATVAAIVEAAARILVESGARALTTNRIAARAGVSVGSLYQYFPNKLAVVRALLERELARAEAARPATLDDPSRPPRERLRSAVNWHLDVHALYPQHGRLLRLLDASTTTPRERRRLRDWRLERVRATLGSFALVPPAELPTVALVLDACLGAAADALASERPAWLRSEDLRERLAAALAALVDPSGRR